MKFPIQQITSNSGNTIPVIFIAEGFTESEQDLFDTYVDHAIDKFNATAPFSTNMDKFQFYKVNSVSKDSGFSKRSHVARPITTELKDTYMKAYSNEIGLERYFNIPKSKRAELFKDLGGKGAIFEGKNFFPIIIVNTEFYGGYGELMGLFPNKVNPDSMSLAIITLGGNVNNFKFLLIHEFGHSFGDLDDEYADAQFLKLAKSYDPDLLSYPNRKNVKDEDPGGWVEGARYLSSGKWRPSSNSLMRSIGATSFGTYNEGLLQDRIDFEVSDTSFDL